MYQWYVYVVILVLHVIILPWTLAHCFFVFLFSSLAFSCLLYFFVFICVYVLYFLCYHDLVNKDLYNIGHWSRNEETEKVFFQNVVSVHLKVSPSTRDIQVDFVQACIYVYCIYLLSVFTPLSDCLLLSNFLYFCIFVLSLWWNKRIYKPMFI